MPEKRFGLRFADNSINFITVEDDKSISNCLPVNKIIKQ